MDFSGELTFFNDYPSRDVDGSNSDGAGDGQSSPDQQRFIIIQQPSIISVRVSYCYSTPVSPQYKIARA